MPNIFFIFCISYLKSSCVCNGYRGYRWRNLEYCVILFYVKLPIFWFQLFSAQYGADFIHKFYILCPKIFNIIVIKFIIFSKRKYILSKFRQRYVMDIWQKWFMNINDMRHENYTSRKNFCRWYMRVTLWIINMLFLNFYLYLFRATTFSFWTV